MPRKKGQGVMEKVVRLHQVIAEAQRELAQIEVRETFDQFLANPTQTTKDRFLTEFGKIEVKPEVPPSLVTVPDRMALGGDTPADLTPPIIQAASDKGKKP